MDNKNNQELIEKLKEIEYIRLDFLNKIRNLEVNKKKIIQSAIKKIDADKIEKIRKEINF